MRRRPIASLLALAGLFVGSLGLAAGPSDDEELQFTVTITNLTRGQIFSPPVVATHSREHVPLFVLGSPASAELAAVAEDAVNGPLVSVLSSDPTVADVETGAAPILPGQSATIELTGSGRFRFLTLVGMLVTTNDAFYALNGTHLLGSNGASQYSPAYDAGSEANDELCASIPGPPCGNAGVRVTSGAEGYVHIHAGVHGIGDLLPAQFDWRNPVARITIQRR